MKGIYILIVQLKKSSRIKISRLGIIDFQKGVYAYIGSAQNNLEKRICRHLSLKKKMHWHIDYLLKNKNAKIIKVFYKIAKKNEECRTAKSILKKGIPIKHFGCSDCRCISHLIKIKTNLISNFPRSFPRVFQFSLNPKH